MEILFLTSWVSGKLPLNASIKLHVVLISSVKLAFITYIYSIADVSLEIPQHTHD